MTGQENNRQFRPHQMTLAEKVEAVEIRQMHVGDDDIEVTIVEFPQSLQPICDRHHLKAMHCEALRKKTACLVLLSD